MPLTDHMTNAEEKRKYKLIDSYNSKEKTVIPKTNNKEKESGIWKNSHVILKTGRRNSE